MKILLATDGSAFSDSAAKFLANLAFSSEDEITVLHAPDLPFKEKVTPHRSSLKKVKKEIAEKIIETTVNTIKPLNTKIDTLLVKGYPGKAIINTAKDKNVDMIVMGSKGIKGLKGLFVGSVTKYVSINSPKPVFVVKPPKKEPDGNLKILSATDSSRYATDTLGFLISMPFPPDTEITILNVIQTGLDIPEKFNVEVNDEIRRVLNEVKSAALKESEKTIDQACRIIGDRFAKVNCLTSDGEPGLEILNMAKGLNADIIVVGGKGMRGMKGMLGSVSRYILGNSECSVLIGKSGQ